MIMVLSIACSLWWRQSFMAVSAALFDLISFTKVRQIGRYNIRALSRSIWSSWINSSLSSFYPGLTERGTENPRQQFADLSGNTNPMVGLRLYQCRLRLDFEPIGLNDDIQL
ncbi:hypothetical protein OSI08_27430, partial [Mycobacterium ulcerans]